MRWSACSASKVSTSRSEYTRGSITVASIPFRANASRTLSPNGRKLPNARIATSDPLAIVRMLSWSCVNGSAAGSAGAAPRRPRRSASVVNVPGSAITTGRPAWSMAQSSMARYSSLVAGARPVNPGMVFVMAMGK